MAQAIPGGLHACGITVDGEVLCWGCAWSDQDQGQRDTPDPTWRPIERL